MSRDIGFSRSGRCETPTQKLSRSGLWEVRMRVPGASPSIECVVRDTRRLALDELKALKPTGGSGSSNERRTDHHRQPCHHQARCVYAAGRRKLVETVLRRDRGDQTRCRLGFLCRFAGDRFFINHFTIVETWHDAKAYEMHVGSEHTVRFRDEIQPFWGSSTPASIVSSARNE